MVGDEIARNPGTDAVAFIGSTTTGRLVAAAAAGKATLLEMGGNGPLVVLADADLDRAVEGAWRPASCAPGRAARPASGYWCTTRYARSSPTGWPTVTDRSGWATHSTTPPRWAR